MTDLLQKSSPLILAHWHGDELALIHLVKRYRLATMTSTSSDGSLVNYVIEKLGGATSRGSSTRGGVSALKGLIRLLRSGRTTSVAVDGPKGPIYIPKPGVFELSKVCGAPIVPVGVAVESAFRFKRSWNKTYLPYPFTKVCVVFGEPLNALTKDDDAHAREHVDQLTNALAVAKQQASKIIAAL